MHEGAVGMVPFSLYLACLNIARKSFSLGFSLPFQGAQNPLCPE